MTRPAPDTKIRVPLLRQAWRMVTFVHWRYDASVAGYLLQMPVRHEPWPLRQAAVTRLDESVTTAAGLPRPSGEPLVDYSDGVTGVAFGAARPVARSAETPAADLRGL